MVKEQGSDRTLKTPLRRRNCWHTRYEWSRAMTQTPLRMAPSLLRPYDGLNPLVSAAIYYKSAPKGGLILTAQGCQKYCCGA